VPRASGGRSINPYERPCKLLDGIERLVNALGLTMEIRVKRANHYARMPGILRVQSNEVHAIHSENYPVFCDGEGENVLIGYGTTRIPSFHAGEHIVTKQPKALDNWNWEILIGVNPYHRLRSLILRDLRLNLLPMAPVIRPRIDQIFRGERRVCTEQIGLTCTETPRLDQ